MRGVCAGVRVECGVSELLSSMYVMNVDFVSVLNNPEWSKNLLTKVAVIMKLYKHSTLHQHEEFQTTLQRLCDLIKYVRNIVYYWLVARGEGNKTRDPIAAATAIYYCDQINTYYCSYRASALIYRTSPMMPDWVFYMLQHVRGNYVALDFPKVPLAKPASIADKEFISIAYEKKG